MALAVTSLDRQPLRGSNGDLFLFTVVINGTVDGTGDVLPTAATGCRYVSSFLSSYQAANVIDDVTASPNSLTDGGAQDDPGNVWVKKTAAGTLTNPTLVFLGR